MRKLALATIVISLLGCGEDKVVSQQEYDNNLLVAKDNALYLAQKWRASNVRYQQYNIMNRGDSSITRTCPQGDGWATITLEEPKTFKGVNLKCSTYSAGQGCWLDSEFKTKPFASEDKKCNPYVESPLKKLQG